LAEIPRLGERGGGWVVLQFALMAAIVAVVIVWPDVGSSWRSVAGAVLFLSGAVVVFLSARALGASLTPFPRPLRASRLVESGPYAVVRHPIYSGGILVFGGIPLALSPWALVGTGVLALTWALKSRVEERFLLERYPAYRAYGDRVRYRLVPYLY
jgi:protein-S-isoprenylcysteine O-methyltransferase Ste14